MIGSDLLILRDRLAQQWRWLLDCRPAHDRYGRRNFIEPIFPTLLASVQTAIAAIDASTKRKRKDRSYDGSTGAF
jgi:hypothetical protein